MREIISIVQFRLKLMLKSPVTIVLLFAMPIVFSLIFGGLQSNSEEVKSKIALVSSNDEYSSDLVALFLQNNKFIWQTEPLDTAKDLVANDEVVAALVIPTDVKKRLTNQEPLFDVIVNQKTEQYLAFAPYVEGISQSIHQIYNDVQLIDPDAFTEVLKDLATNKIIELEDTPLQDVKENSVNVTPIGFTLMFMMFAIASSAASIHTERSDKTWQRLLISPITRLQLLTAYLLSLFILGWIQFATLMIVMTLVFQMDWGNLLYFIPFASLVIVSIVGYGLMMASVLKTKKQTEILNAVIIVSTCMLSGIYWPLDIVPPFMRQIANFLPQTWMMSGFEEIMQGNIILSILGMSSFILVIFTIVFLTIGLFNLRKITN